MYLMTQSCIRVTDVRCLLYNAMQLTFAAWFLVTAVVSLHKVLQQCSLVAKLMDGR